MYTIQHLDLSWGAQLAVVRLILLSQLLMLVISAVRFTKSAQKMYRFAGKSVSLESILNQEMDPDSVAACAFAHRLPDNRIVENALNSASPEAGTVAHKTLGFLDR